MGGKWLELLTEVAPGVKRATIMFNPDTAPYARSYYLPSFEAASRLFKVAPIVAPVHSEQYDCRAMNLRKGIRQDDEAASRLAPKRGYDRFDFGWIAAR